MLWMFFTAATGRRTIVEKQRLPFVVIIAEISVVIPDDANSFR